MRIATQVIVAALAAVACGHTPHTAMVPSASAAEPAVEATPTPPTSPPVAIASPVDPHFTGELTGATTHPKVDVALCAHLGGRISAMVTGQVGHEPVTLQIVVNNVVVGD